jgi:hypothetical protein
MDPTATGLANATGFISKKITLREDEEPCELVITKIRAKQFVAIFKKIDELVDAGVVKLTDETGAFIFSAKGIFTQFSETKLILRGGEPVLDILSIVSGLPREIIDELDLVDLAKIIGAVWETSERFFVQNQTVIKEALGPLWAMAETLITALQQATTTSSPSESTPDSSISSSVAATEP